MESESWVRQPLQNLVLRWVGVSIPEEKAADRNNRIIPNKGTGNESQRSGT